MLKKSMSPPFLIYYTIKQEIHMQDNLEISRGPVRRVSQKSEPETEACFRSRRFPIEIARPDKYMKIKSSPF
jgi:hypothetical protein